MSEKYKKIEKLTPEMEERIPVVRDKWIEIGLKTGECNRERVNAKVDDVYKVANLTPPEKKYWFDSPLKGVIAAAMYHEEKPIEDLKEKDFEDYLRDHRDKVTSALYKCGYGNHDGYWLSFYDYFLEYLDDIEEIRPLIDMSQEVGWWWAFEDAVVFTEFPTFLNTDDEGRLHHEDRMAIEYKDGFGLYVWHGVRVPADIILYPEKITPDQILKESNQEMRRILLERYGMDRFLSGQDTKEIHRDDYGILLEYAGFDDDNEQPARFVQVVDPSTGRQYALRVPPTMETAREAVAWTFDVEGDNYQLEQES